MEKQPVFENKWVKLVERENYMVYETPNLVCVLPVLPNGDFLLINQYRIPIEKKVTELVTGSVEKHENTEDAAIREVLEETGYTTKQVAFVGSYYSAPGYISQKAFVYIAHVADFVGNALEAHEEVFGLKTVRVKQEDMRGLIEKGESHPYLTIAYQHLQHTK